MKIRKVDWYHDEWLASVAMLTPAERGVYDTLINMIYSHGGPIIMTPEWPRLFNCHGNQLNAVIKRLEKLGKITRNGPEITVKRWGNEIEFTRNRPRKSLENGQKGGRPLNENNYSRKPDGFPDKTKPKN